MGPSTPLQGPPPTDKGAAPVSLNNPCLKELTLAPRVRNPAAAHPSLYHLHYAAKDPGIYYARPDPRRGEQRLTAGKAGSTDMAGR